MSKNILQRINAVMKAVEYVKKDSKVQNQYSAVSHDMVTAVLRKSIIAEGIVIAPTLIKSDVVDTGKKTSKGTPTIRYEAVYRVSFINIDKPTDLIFVDMESHAEDTGDKAPGKAISYATKYAMLKVFSLETGDNEESRIPAEIPLITEDQVNEIDAKIVESGIKKEGFMKWLASDIKCNKIEEINVNAYPLVLKRIASAIRALQAGQAK